MVLLNALYILGFILVAVVFVFVAYVFIERMYPHEQRITTKEAAELIQKEGARVVDVRTQAEWNAGHFPSAIHIPASRIGEEAPKKLDRTDTIIVYCNTGTRARNAAIILKELGFTRTYYIAETYHEL